MNLKDNLQVEYAKARESYLAAKKSRKAKTCSKSEVAKDACTSISSRSQSIPVSIYQGRSDVSKQKYDFSTSSRPALPTTSSTSNVEHVVDLQKRFVKELKTSGLHAGREKALQSLFYSLSEAQNNAITLLTSSAKDWVRHADYMENSFSNTIDKIETDLEEAIQEKELTEKELKESKEKCVKLRNSLERVKHEAGEDMKKITSERDKVIIARREDMKKIVSETEEEIENIKVDMVVEAKKLVDITKKNAEQEWTVIVNEMMKKKESGEK